MTSPPRPASYASAPGTRAGPHSFDPLRGRLGPRCGAPRRIKTASPNVWQRRSEEADLVLVSIRGERAVEEVLFTTGASGRRCAMVEDPGHITHVDTRSAEPLLPG